MSINSLFRHENKIMIFILIGPFIIGVLLAFIAPLLMELSSIDTCLDAGGSFNYDSSSCDFEHNHVAPISHNCQ